MAGGGGNEPNLTPFIDLFSVLICFLLMTAAWLQLDSLNTSIDKATSSDKSSTESKPDEKKVQFGIVMKPTSVTLKQDQRAIDIPNVRADFDQGKIKYYLVEWKKRFPDRRDIVLSTESGVLYGSMISMYDLLISSGWPDVGINPQ